MSINTVSPIKRTFKYEPREREIFEEWFQENVSFDALSRVELVSLHQDYQKYVAQCTETVPLSKNKFSSLLRNHLSEEIERLKVRAHTSARVTFQGLLIKKTTCEAQTTG